VVISSLSTRKFKDLYNVHCFIFEWKTTIQVVEHGSSTNTRRCKFWKLKFFFHWFYVICLSRMIEKLLYVERTNAQQE
jgi:hypothetical protein